MSGSLLVPAGGKKEVSLAASDKIAIYTPGTALLYQEVGYPQYPSKLDLISDIANEEYLSSAVSAAATFVIDNSGNPYPALYEIGAAPVIKDAGRKLAPVQGDPVAVNTTGSVSAAAILGGIVTSTTGAAVAGTIPTGTVMDASSEFAIGDSVDWCVINTGGANTFTVTAASDHTIVGAAAVANSTSGQFRTRKTAANTFVTYRLG
jgi:hypothetical protein